MKIPQYALKRASICNSCKILSKPNWICNECGCFMKIKVMIAEEKCPINKWLEEKI